MIVNLRQEGLNFDVHWSCFAFPVIVRIYPYSDSANHLEEFDESDFVVPILVFVVIKNGHFRKHKAPSEQSPGNYGPNFTFSIFDDCVKQAIRTIEGKFVFGSTIGFNSVNLENALQSNSIFPKQHVDLGAAPNDPPSYENLRFPISRSNVRVYKLGQELTQLGVHEFALGS